MAAEDASDNDALLGPPPATVGAAITAAQHAVYQNTVRDTWGWLWKDTLIRLVPFATAAGLYARFSDDGVRAIGLTSEHWARDVACGVLLGIPMAGSAIAFRSVVAPRYRLPTPADQTLQTLYYLALNAPVEEMFWRGTLQTAAIEGLRHVPRLRRAAPVLGWALTTAGFGVFHRLGNWSWRAIAGVTAAGGLFGVIYLVRPKDHSILLPTVIHGFATAGFLSWGDAVLHLRARRRNRHVAAGR